MKGGLYASSQDQPGNASTVFLDNLKVGDVNSSLEEVRGTAGTVTPPPPPEPEPESEPKTIKNNYTNNYLMVTSSNDVVATAATPDQPYEQFLFITSGSGFKIRTVASSSQFFRVDSSNELHADATEANGTVFTFEKVGTADAIKAPNGTYLFYRLSSQTVVAGATTADATNDLWTIADV
jgi:hypothetical protein